MKGIAAPFGNAILGIWLMASPSLLDYGGAARLIDLIVGPIAASFATIAIWDVCRSAGKVNLAFGLWLLMAPWAVGYETFQATANSSVAGALMAWLAWKTGDPQGSYGGGWASLLRRK